MSMSFPEPEAELIEERTDNISRFVRTRMRAGDLVLRTVGDDGTQFDPDKLTDIIIGDDPRGTSEASDEDIVTIQTDLTEPILRNLPHKDETEDSDIDFVTLRELVFGTQEEQIEQIKETFDELYAQDRVTNDLDNNLYRTD